MYGNGAEQKYIFLLDHQRVYTTEDSANTTDRVPIHAWMLNVLSKDDLNLTIIEVSIRIQIRSKTMWRWDPHMWVRVLQVIFYGIFYS